MEFNIWVWLGAVLGATLALLGLVMWVVAKYGTGQDQTDDEGSNSE